MKYVKDKTGTKFLDKAKITLRELLTLLDEFNYIELYGNTIESYTDEEYNHEEYIAYKKIYDGRVKGIKQDSEYLDEYVDYIDICGNVVKLEMDENAQVED